MVLSTTKRTSSVLSLINQDYGGGMKKFGFAPRVGFSGFVSRTYKRSSCMGLCTTPNFLKN